MPNIANALREEIIRISRREVRKHTAVLKRASIQYRHDAESASTSMNAWRTVRVSIPMRLSQCPLRTPTVPAGSTRTNGAFRPRPVSTCF
jgi:hypothetical protein